MACTYCCRQSTCRRKIFLFPAFSSSSPFLPYFLSGSSLHFITPHHIFSSLFPLLSPPFSLFDLFPLLLSFPHLLFNSFLLFTFPSPHFLPPPVLPFLSYPLISFSLLSISPPFLSFLFSMFMSMFPLLASPLLFLPHFFSLCLPSFPLLSYVFPVLSLHLLSSSLQTFSGLNLGFILCHFNSPIFTSFFLLSPLYLLLPCIIFFLCSV